MASDGFAVDLRAHAWMTRAIELAGRCAASDDVPVGALVVDGAGDIVGEGWNEREASHDPTAHAEVLALRRAAERLGRWRLDDCTLVVTLEPCAMCAGALVAARVGTVVFGASDPKAGACGSVWDLVRDHRANHELTVVPGVREQAARDLLLDFFAARRVR